MKLSYRLVNGLLFLFSVIGMGFALYLEHVEHLNPCPLCIFQRVGLMAMGLFALLAFLHHPKSMWGRRIYSLLTSLGLTWSALIAVRHIWIQHLPADQVPSCGPGLNYLIQVFPFKDVVAQVLQGSGECAKIEWTLLGQSLPVWSLLFFVFLLLFSLWQLMKPNR